MRYCFKHVFSIHTLSSCSIWWVWHLRAICPGGKSQELRAWLGFNGFWLARRLSFCLVNNATSSAVNPNFLIRSRCFRWVSVPAPVWDANVDHEIKMEMVVLKPAVSKHLKKLFMLISITIRLILDSTKSCVMWEDAEKRKDIAWRRPRNAWNLCRGEILSR